MMYTAFAFGWLLVFVSTVLINHFDLFGLRQVWLSSAVRRQLTMIALGFTGTAAVLFYVRTAAERPGRACDIPLCDRALPS